MSWLSALVAGMGLGLVSVGALWLTVQRIPVTFPGRCLLVAGSVGRLVLVGVGLYGLSRDGPVPLLAGCLGLLLARQGLLWDVTRKCHER